MNIRSPLNAGIEMSVWVDMVLDYISASCIT